MCKINRNMLSKTDQLILFPVFCIDYLEDYIFKRLQKFIEKLLYKAVNKEVHRNCFEEIILWKKLI